jgi:hypothetical protein
MPWLWFWRRRNCALTPSEAPCVKALKNALLTLALQTVHADRVEKDTLFDGYASMDGTKLPIPAGCDLVSACFSYVIDRAEFRRDPWYTVGMEQKIDAIEQYIGNNLDTQQKVEDLFTAFADLLEPPPPGSAFDSPSPSRSCPRVISTCKRSCPRVISTCKRSCRCSSSSSSSFPARTC